MIAPGRAANARVLVLFLRQRGLLATVLSLAGSVAVLLVLGDWVNESGQKLRGYSAVLMLPAMVASIVGVAAWSPAGDLEQVASYKLWLPRGVHLGCVLFVGLASTTWAVGRWVVEVPAGVDLALVWVRNAIFLTGLCLIVACRFPPRQSWVAPVGIALILTGYFFQPLSESGQSGAGVFDQPWWNVLGQDQASWHSWVIAVASLVVGLWAFAWFGTRVFDPAEV